MTTEKTYDDLLLECNALRNARDSYQRENLSLRESCDNWRRRFDSSHETCETIRGIIYDFIGQMIDNELIDEQDSAWEGVERLINECDVPDPRLVSMTVKMNITYSDTHEVTVKLKRSESRSSVAEAMRERVEEMLQNAGVDSDYAYIEVTDSADTDKTRELYFDSDISLSHFDVSIASVEEGMPE